LGVHPKLEKRTRLEIGFFGCPKCLSAHLALFGHVLTNKGRNRGVDARLRSYLYSDDGFYYSREELTKNHIQVGKKDLLSVIVEYNDVDKASLNVKIVG